MNKDIDELNKKLKLAFSCIQNNNHLEAIKIYEEIYPIIKPWIKNFNY